MRPVVVDASFALAWCFEEAESIEARKLLARVDQWRLMAPQLWELEVTNGLVMAERRGRLTMSESGRFLELLEDLGVEVDQDGGTRMMERTLALARLHELTAYDAAYLELAMREEAVLASFDEKLRKASKKAGVEVWGRAPSRG